MIVCYQYWNEFLPLGEVKKWFSRAPLKQLLEENKCVMDLNDLHLVCYWRIKSLK